MCFTFIACTRVVSSPASAEIIVPFLTSLNLMPFHSASAGLEGVVNSLQCTKAFSVGALQVKKLSKVAVNKSAGSFDSHDALSKSQAHQKVPPVFFRDLQMHHIRY